MARQDAEQQRERGWIVQAFGIPEGRPTVLLHGFMQDASSWAQVAEGLASDFYAVAPTMEPSSPEAATLEDLAEGVHGVVQQALIHSRTRDALVVGYSLGGRIALSYAARHPETVSGLVLESAGLGPEDEDDRVALEQRNELWARRFEEAASMEEAVQAWESEPLFATQRFLDEELLAAQRKIRLRCNKQHLVWMLRAAGAHTMPLAAQACETLAKAKIPVLYLAGRADAKGVACAERLDALGEPHIRTQRFDCGHNIHLEDTAAFVESLRRFAKEGA